MYGFYGKNGEYRINAESLEIKASGAWEPVSKNEAIDDVFAQYAEDQAASKLERHPVTSGVISRIEAAKL